MSCARSRTAPGWCVPDIRWRAARRVILPEHLTTTMQARFIIGCIRTTITHLARSSRPLPERPEDGISDSRRGLKCQWKDRYARHRRRPGRTCDERASPQCRRSHLVLERARIAERWRSERWDSLVANGPAWHDRFPDLDFAEVDGAVGPDDFPHKETVADYFVAFAQKNRRSRPLRRGGAVRGAAGRPHPASGLKTSLGPSRRSAWWRPPGRSSAEHSGPDPAGGAAPADAFHRLSQPGPASRRRGAGGGRRLLRVQIAEELMRSGRTVYLSVGPHDRPPRAYRGRDFVWWLGVLGKWMPPAGARQGPCDHCVSGARGAGHTIDFPPPRQRGHGAGGPHRGLCERRALLRAGPVRESRQWRRQFRALLDEADAYVGAQTASICRRSRKRVSAFPTPSASPIRSPRWTLRRQASQA